jgi:hypothetical protein
MSGKITTAILADLEAKARAATRGKWITDHEGHLHGAINCGKKHIALANYFNCHDDESRVTNTKNNAAYIASACPDVVLALIEELRNTQKALYCACENLCAPKYAYDNVSCGFSYDCRPEFCDRRLEDKNNINSKWVCKNTPIECNILYFMSCAKRSDKI